MTDVRFIAAPANQQVQGILGYVEFVLNDEFVIDAVQVRRTALGRTTLSYVHRVDGRGMRRFWIRPLSEVVRSKIEAQVFAALGIKSTESAP